MELTRRSAFKLIGGAVLSFGPLRLPAAGGTIPKRAWDSTHWSSYAPMVTHDVLIGVWKGLRNDGQMFYATAYLDAREMRFLASGATFSERLEFINKLAIDGLCEERRKCREALDTFLDERCHCSANPQIVCDMHREMFHTDEHGIPLLDGVECP